MISGVKCRTRRALDFRTHIAASGLSRGFVCLRVGMKLNTLYKSVSVEYASVAVLVRLIPTPDHELRLDDLLRSNACCRSLIGDIRREHYTFRRANDCVRRLRHVHSLKSVRRVSGQRWQNQSLIRSVGSTDLFCRPQIKRDYPLNLSI